jgi:hypothetical protein
LLVENTPTLGQLMMGTHQKSNEGLLVHEQILYILDEKSQIIPKWKKIFPIPNYESYRFEFRFLFGFSDWLCVVYRRNIQFVHIKNPQFSFILNLPEARSDLIGYFMEGK